MKRTKETQDERNESQTELSNKIIATDATKEKREEKNQQTNKGEREKKKKTKQNKKQKNDKIPEQRFDERNNQNTSPIKPPINWIGLW